MAFVPTPHGARIVQSLTRGTESFSYTWYATKAGYDHTALVELANLVDNVFNAGMKSNFSTGITYVGCTCYDARESDGEVVVDTGSAGPGTMTGEPLPINLAVCVTLRTAGRGRSSRGRKYISGFTESLITSGEWSATAVAAAANLCTNTIQAIQDAGWSAVIRSIQQDGVLLSTANVRAITSIMVRSNKVATQRRRVDRP